MGVITGGVELHEVLTGAAVLGDDARSRSEQAVVEALLRCVARWGLTKTTAEDVAREAGMSRATLYRLFPGGKGAVVEAAGNHEIARLVLELQALLPAAATLDDALVLGVSTTARFIHDHEALGYLMRHEPRVVEHFIAFDRLDPVFAIAEIALGPLFDRFVGRGEGGPLAAWVTRLLVSYLIFPSAHLDLLSETDVRRFVTAFVLPGCAIEAPAGRVDEPTFENHTTGIRPAGITPVRS